MSLENPFRILSVLGMDIRTAWPSGGEPWPIERVTPDFIRERVARSRRERPPRADLDDLLCVVCELYGLVPEELADPSRRRVRSEARSMAACLMRRHRHLSLVRLGRDASSLCHGRERLEARMESDPPLRKRLRRAESLLQREDELEVEGAAREGPHRAVSEGRSLAPLKLADEIVDPVGDLGQQEQIVPAEAVGAFPSAVPLVEAGEGDVEAGAFGGGILPDGRLDGSDSDSGSGRIVLTRHVGFLLLSSGDLFIRPGLGEQRRWNGRT